MGGYIVGKKKYSESKPRLQLGFKLFFEGATDKEVERQQVLTDGPLRGNVNAIELLQKNKKRK